MTKQRRLKDVKVEKPPLQMAPPQDDAAIVAEKKQLEELRQEIANKKAELSAVQTQLNDTLTAVNNAKTKLEETKTTLDETADKVKEITETMRGTINDAGKLQLTVKLDDKSRKEVKEYETKATNDFKSHLNTFIGKVKKLKGQDQVLLTEDTFYTLVFLLVWFAPLAILGFFMNVIWLQSKKIYWVFFFYTAICAIYIGAVWYLRYRRNHNDRNW